MDGILIALLGGLLGVAIHAGLQFLSRGKAKGLESGVRSIRPSPILLVTVSILCLAFIGASAFALAHDPKFWPAWALLLMFSLLTLSFSQGFRTKYEVRWDSSTLSGPRSILLPPFGGQRNELRWTAISKIRIGNHDRWIAEDIHGGQVSWSKYYAGWEDLHREIIRRRPDLAHFLDRP